MKWKATTLQAAQRLSFPDGKIATVYCDELDSHEAALIANFSNGIELRLLDAVDTSELEDWPRIFVFEGACPEEVFVFGGPVAHYLRSNGVVAQTLPTFRTRDAVEYWRTNVIAYDEMAIIIYETGVLAIDETLQPRWHRRKYFTEHFDHVEDGNLMLRSGLMPGRPIRVVLRLRNGDLVQAPEDYRPGEPASLR